VKVKWYEDLSSYGISACNRLTFVHNVNKVQWRRWTKHAIVPFRGHFRVQRLQNYKRKYVSSPKQKIIKNLLYSVIKLKCYMFTSVGARFSAPVQTGPGAYPASCTMGTGSFPGVKRQRSGVDHPPLSSAEVKERVQLYLYSPSGPSWPVLGWTLPLPYIFTYEVHLAVWLSTSRKQHAVKSNICRGGQTPGTSSPRLLDFVWWRPIFLGPQ
jgi:hypothetical protein